MNQIAIQTIAIALFVATTACAQDAGPLRNPGTLTEQAPPAFSVAFDTSKGRFFRVIGGQLAQFGMHGDPGVQTAWRNADIQDDPVRHSNVRGTISFASRGPNTRTTQLFINLRDNSPYDRLGFSPFAEVVSGMEVVDQLYSGYEERPEQPLIDEEGNTYLTRAFPDLDYIVKATILPEQR